MSPTADATETYYETMASSLGDKERILPHLVPGTIADVGSGGGVLANSLVSRGYHVVGIDPNPRPVDGVEVHPIYADQIGTVTPAEKFDNIIACAVLHEVFSYGNRHQQPGRLQNLEGTLREFRRSLKTGGRLIVRDGVKPAEPHASMTLHQWDDADVQRFVDASPFTSPGTDVGITLERTAPGYWEGSGSSVMECAFTLTWGPEAFEREVQEFYAPFTLVEYADFVQRWGFKLISTEPYVQPEYVEHLEGVVTLDGYIDGFPHTNAIWVYEAI